VAVLYWSRNLAVNAVFSEIGPCRFNSDRSPFEAIRSKR